MLVFFGIVLIAFGLFATRADQEADQAPPVEASDEDPNLQVGWGSMEVSPHENYRHQILLASNWNEFPRHAFMECGFNGVAEILVTADKGVKAWWSGTHCLKDPPGHVSCEYVERHQIHVDGTGIGFVDCLFHELTFIRVDVEAPPGARYVVRGSETW